jgi:hypothetical protein
MQIRPADHKVARLENGAGVPKDRFLTLASLCTIVGVRDTITTLLAGASVHLLDPTSSNRESPRDSSITSVLTRRT